MALAAAAAAAAAALVVLDLPAVAAGAVVVAGLGLLDVFARLGPRIGRSGLSLPRGAATGAFVAHLLDRGVDLAVLGSLAWVSRVEDPVVSGLAVGALGASMVASYERARGRSLGYRGRERAPYLAVRTALLALALVGPVQRAALVALLAVAVAAGTVRAWSVAVQHRRLAPGAGAAP